MTSKQLIVDVGVGDIKLPAKYHSLTWQERRQVREQYITNQKDKCFYCGEDIYKDPPKRITDKDIEWKYFPGGIKFLDYPIHLQHNHDSDLTEGAVHSYCNAVMWQYEGK